MRTSAFENIAHKNLLDKMKCIGFSDETIFWFQSSFAHTTFASLDNVFSKLLPKTVN